MRSRSVRAALAAVAGLFTLVLGAGSVLALGEGTTTFTLDNGMQVVVIPDHRAPVVTHMVWYRVGAADEPRGQSGVAHFLEHLMFKGTEKIAPGEFSRIVARHGGQDNAFTSQDYTGYFQRIAKDRLPLVMEMEADRMSNLQLSDEHVLPERDVVIEERRSRVDNEPASRFGEQLDATFYLSHPYGQPVIGWMHEIEALDREKAIAFYERYYTPNNAILIVAGDVTEQEIRPLAERIYGQIPVRAEVAPRQRPKEPPHEAAQRLTLKDPRVTTPLLRRQYIVPSYSTAEPGEAEALDLLGHILGGGTTSRLYRELVVEDQIASYAAAWYAGDYLDSGTFNFGDGDVTNFGNAEFDNSAVSVGGGDVSNVADNLVEDGSALAVGGDATTSYEESYEETSVEAHHSQVATEQGYGDLEQRSDLEIEVEVEVENEYGAHGNGI